MKNLKAIQFIILLLITSLSFAGETKDNYTIKVDGLACPFCAYGLEKKFKEFKSIKDTKIDMETGVFTFTYPSGEALTIAQVEQKVKDAGYTPIHTKIIRANGKHETSSKTATAVDKDKIITQQLIVSGNCGMCQARIEKAALDTKGVTQAQWNNKTQELSVSFDQSKVSLKTIAKNIAASGHDTKYSKAPSTTYEKLPACCQYK